ncbi:MAG: substrate-binding periplasmic protein [Thermodesulfobacteriota bacterium]
MSFLTRLTLWVLPLVFWSFNGFCGDLALYTENYPPYNYEQAGEVRGVNTELLLRAAEKGNVNIVREDILVLPWARAYSSVLHTPDSCVYTTMRTEKREPLFKWVGPLVNTEKVLVGLKKRGIQIDALKDAQGYVIGTVIDDVCGHMLLDAGVPEKNIDPTSSALLNLRKLMRGRIDLVAYDKLTLNHIAKQNGMDFERLETVYVIGKGDHYLACNPNSNATILGRLQKGLNSIQY